MIHAQFSPLQSPHSPTPADYIHPPPPPSSLENYIISFEKPPDYKHPISCLTLATVTSRNTVSYCVTIFDRERQSVTVFWKTVSDCIPLPPYQSLIRTSCWVTAKLNFRARNASLKFAFSVTLSPIWSCDSDMWQWHDVIPALLASRRRRVVFICQFEFWDGECDGSIDRLSGYWQSKSHFE